MEQLYVPCGFWIWTMAAGRITILGWGDGLALYSSDEYSFLYCRCFLFWFGFLGFVCMLITFFLGIPSLHRLCQDFAPLFLFWFEFNVLTWQQFQLNSISFFSEQYNVSCSKNNFRHGWRLVTRENPQSGKMQWKVTCDHTKLISNPQTSGYCQTRNVVFFISEEQRFPANIHKMKFWREKSLSSSILCKRSSLKELSTSMHPEKNDQVCCYCCIF